MTVDSDDADRVVWGGVVVCCGVLWCVVLYVVASCSGSESEELALNSKATSAQRPREGLAILITTADWEASDPLHHSPLTTLPSRLPGLDCAKQAATPPSHLTARPRRATARVALSA